MGWSPDQVDRASLWQFAAAVGGFVKANSSGEDSLNAEEAAGLAEWLDAPPSWER